MVATRSGFRVGSPAKNTNDETSAAMDENGIVMEGSVSQSELDGDSQPDEKDSSAGTLPANLSKSETRRSTRHLVDKKQPDSTQEADVSESESCCSVVIDVLATPRTQRSTVGREKPKEPVLYTRKTRHGIVMEGSVSQSELDGDSQPDEKDNSAAPSLPANLSKRETRRSTRHLVDKKQPDSTQEADVSESESCCSVVIDVQATPRTRRRTVGREKPKVTTVDNVSEVESCSSAVSASRSQRASRSLRKRVQTPSASDATKTDDGNVSEAESSSSVVSLTRVLETRMITRSCRKTVTVTEADLSEPISCSSSVSSIRGSTVRRSTRNRTGKSVEPIPLSLEETTDAPFSPVSNRLRGRGRKNYSEEGCDSDDCKSGPSASPWRSTVRQAKGDVLIGESDSESVLTDVYISRDSPSSLKGRGTPCSSRTGSASSNRAVPVARTRSKARVTSDLSTTLTSVPTMPEEEKEDEEHEPIPLQSESVVLDAEEPVEPMDSTMTMETSEAQECTMIEDTAVDIALFLEPDENVESAEKLEPQNLQKMASESAEQLESRGDQEEAADEMVATVTEDRDVAMENSEPEFVKANHAVEEARTDDVLLSTAEKSEKVEEMAKGVKVSKDADKTITTSVGGTSTLGNDEERPSSSSITEQPSKRSSSRKEMISLLDSSEDEESADEVLSADEEDEGSSQKAVDGIREEVMCCDEGQSSSGAHGNRLFVIDNRPGLRPDEKYYVDAKQAEEEAEEDFVDEEEDEDDEDSKLLFAPRKPLILLSSSIDPGLKMKELGGLYISFDGSKPKGVSSGLKTQNNQDELLKKSVIGPDVEKKDALPQQSKREAKFKRKTEREKTTGDGWFNMKAPELTEELRNDLKAQKMRSAVDPKRFYKKNDREGFPKYFQMGTVVDNPVDFYHSRIPKKQRKRTIVEELLADAEFRSYNKRKYQEIMTEQAAQTAGKMNKKHNFHKKKMNK